MNNKVIEKAQVNNIADLIKFVPHLVVSRDIIKKNTGSISVVAFDTGEELYPKKSPFDVFIELIEGKAEITIDNDAKFLVAGQGIIIPAHASNKMIACMQTKMLITIIKSGYEQDI